MKTKIVTSILAVIGAAALLTGCSTANQGGLGSDTEYGGGAGSSQPVSGPNGSISPSNPFGLGTGTGLTPAH
jgi:hypothetical protein